jgi:hypothetical protein
LSAANCGRAALLRLTPARLYASSLPMKKHSCIALLLASAALAQRQVSVQGILRDPKGAAVTDAVILLQPCEASFLPALAGYVLPAPPIESHSNARGEFLIPSALPGLLLARTANGLGAIEPMVMPSRAVRMQLMPMAELNCGGKEPFTLWPAWLAFDGTRHHLPAQSGTDVRLPAGTYEIWCELAEGFRWQRITLSSGQQSVLPPATDRLRLTQSEPSIVRAFGFPQVTLLDLSRTSSTLLGDAQNAELTAEWPRLLLSVPIRAASARDKAATLQLPGPPPATDQLFSIQLSGLPESTSARAFLIAQSSSGTRRVLACSTSNAQQRILVPRTPLAGDLWLIVTAAGFAPLAVAHSTIANDTVLTLKTGRTLSCRVLTNDAQPAVGVMVDFIPGDASPATIRSPTNDLGITSLGPIAATGMLSVTDAQYGTAKQALALSDSVTLKLDLLAIVRGRILDPQGKPIALATVILRDPTGKLVPAERATTSDTDGTFSFCGLPEDALLVLFAQQIREGKTWSGRADVPRDGSFINLTLKNEDPQLRPVPNGH